jgi:hypothetical protein
MESECNIKGILKGETIDNPSANNSRACHEACKKNHDCHWYSFHDSGVCDLLSSYDTLDKTCTKCVSGKKECQFVEPCPPQWSELGESCYLLTKNKKTFDKTRQVCKTLKGDLAIIKSKQEHDFIHRMMKGRNVTDVYLGATDRKSESHFKWFDGTFVDDGYSKWDTNQPDDQGKGHENCLQIRNNRWNDINCDHHFIGACEKPVAL